MIPDPSNPQVGDVFIDAYGNEMTIGIVGTADLAYSWVDEHGDVKAGIVGRNHVARYWKPERRRSTPIVTGVEFADGRRTIVPDWDAARARAYFPEFVRIGPARVVFVEDEQ